MNENRMAAISWDEAKRRVPRVEERAFFGTNAVCAVCRQWHYCFLLMATGSERQPPVLIPTCVFCMRLMPTSPTEDDNPFFEVTGLFHGK